MIKVSIIVPAYNAERTIARCINSILYQTFRNLEIIVVDDGSKDCTPSMLDDYSTKDSRMVIIHQPNGGVSAARNEGLRRVTGDWIYFLDSDDWIEPVYIDNFVKNSNGYELIIQGFTKENVSTNNSVNVLFCPDHKLKNYEVVELLQNTPNVHNGFLWHRMFKASIVKEFNLSFPHNCNFAEDGVFFLRYIKYVHNTNILNTAGHHYIVQEQSLTSKRYECDYYIHVASLYADALKDITGDFEYRKFTDIYIWRLLFYWIIVHVTSRENKNMKNELNSVRKFIAKYKLVYPTFELFIFSKLYDSFIKRPNLLHAFVFTEKKFINITRKMKI